MIAWQHFAVEMWVCRAMQAQGSCADSRSTFCVVTNNFQQHASICKHKCNDDRQMLWFQHADVITFGPKEHTPTAQCEKCKYP